MVEAFERLEESVLEIRTTGSKERYLNERKGIICHGLKM
jgi:hypothetical protein